MYAEFDDGVDISYKFKAAFLFVGLTLLDVDHHRHYKFLYI